MKHVEAHHKKDFVKQKQAAEAAKQQKDMESLPPPLKKQKLTAMWTAHLNQMQLPGALTPHKIWDTNDPPTQTIQ